MTAPALREEPIRVPIREDADVAAAHRRARTLAVEQGLDRAAAEAAATAVSEVARNIVVHARTGELLLAPVREGARRGIGVVARDEGLGIADPERAMQDGFSTVGSLGLGLSSARRLMDQFELVSGAGRGTVVKMKKWAR